MDATFYHAREIVLESRLAGLIVQHAFDARQAPYQIYASSERHESLKLEGRAYQGVRAIVEGLCMAFPLGNSEGNCDHVTSMMNKLKENMPLKQDLKNYAFGHMLSACPCYTDHFSGHAPKPKRPSRQLELFKTE